MPGVSGTITDTTQKAASATAAAQPTLGTRPRRIHRSTHMHSRATEKAMSAARDDATIRELAHSRKQNRCHRHLTQAFHLPSQDPLPKGHGILSSS